MQTNLLFFLEICCPLNFRDQNPINKGINDDVAYHNFSAMPKTLSYNNKKQHL